MINRIPKLGDAFCIATRCGSCRFQYVQMHRSYGQLISVLEHDENNLDVTLCARAFDIFFPVNAAAKDRSVKFLGNFTIPSVYGKPVPLKYPLINISQNTTTGWIIEEGDESRRVANLSETEKNYAYAFAINIAELEKLYCNGWNSTMPYPELR